MKKLVLAVMALAVFAAPAAAVEVSGDAYGVFVDKYVWRGVLVEDEAAIQAGTDVSFGGFTLSYWTNTHITGTNSDTTTETDIVLDYTFSPVEKLSVSVGDITYQVGTESTHEAYLGLGLDVLLAPSLTVYYDWDDASTADLDGLYYSLAVGHDLELAKGLGMSLGATLNYSDESPYVYQGAGAPFSGLSTADLSVGLSYALTEQVSIDASYTQFLVVGDDAEDIGLMDDEGYGGIGITLAF